MTPDRITAATPDELLGTLQPIMKAIAGAVGPHCEVVLHDLSQREMERTIVAIENGHVTGREVGGPSSGCGRARRRAAGLS